MSNPIRHIRESLSLRLSFSILGFTVGVFVISIGFLFYKSRAAVRQSAFAQATKELDNTALQISGILQEVETATNNTDWQVLEHLQPDSAYALSIRILELNPNLNGCSIAFEPSFFEEQGKYFSAYSGNNEGHIETEQEGNEEYNYFEMAWYKEPKQKKRACWIDPFHDYDSNNDEFEKDMIASYSKPLITADGRFVGVISSDLSQKRLSTILRHENFYPNAYSILTGTSGRIIAAGKDNPSLDDLERKDCIVLSKELGNTEWMLYIICPEGDIFKGYNQLIYFIISIILFGLLLMLISCYVIVSHAVDPIHLLAKQTDDMANRKFNERMPQSTRIDSIGKLQNSFGAMQESIAGYVEELKRVKAETEHRNQDLLAAQRLAEEADHNKMVFIQDISHQIRTPLNIISGFAQVLRDSLAYMDKQEIEEITETMLQNSDDITTIVSHLMTSSALESNKHISCNDDVACYNICWEVVKMIRLKYPDTVTLGVKSSVDEELTIKTNKECLVKILKELLNNANRFTQSGEIIMGCDMVNANMVAFSVSDTGPGIPAAESERIFTRFCKIDSFTAGLGLGLTLSRQLARLLGGDLRIDPLYYNGTRVVLTLPFKSQN